VKVPIVGWVVDERYLNHRLQASSLGGIAGGLVALLLLGYHFYFNHVWSWDLFAVVATILGVKLAVMGWCVLND